MKIYNAFGMRFRGAWRKTLVVSSWKGRPYLRAYAVPTGPPSERQVERRQRFAEASAAWKRLTPEERKAYDRAARRMSGYNLFIKRYLRGPVDPVGWGPDRGDAGAVAAAARPMSFLAASPPRRGPLHVRDPEVLC